MENLETLRTRLARGREDNGALKVFPGIHRLGRLSTQQIEACRRQMSAVTCPANAGDVLLMRPLLLHSSAPAVRPGRRRVIHLEYAANELPGELEWCG